MRAPPTGAPLPWPEAEAAEAVVLRRGRRAEGRQGGGTAVARGRRGRGRAPRRFGRLLIPAVLVASTAVALLLGVLPTRSYLDKRAEVRAAEARLVALQEQNAAVAAEVEALDTDAEIERRARQEFGLAKPGEETYVVLPPPKPRVEVPEGWPFVELEARVRAGG